MLKITEIQETMLEVMLKNDAMNKNSSNRFFSPKTIETFSFLLKLELLFLVKYLFYL